MRPDGVLEMRCPPSPFETLAIARGTRAWSRLRLAPQDEGGPRPRPQACGLDFAQASPPLIPAHSASKTRVNALMAGNQVIIEKKGPRFCGGERGGLGDSPPAARARAFRRCVGGRRR